MTEFFSDYGQMLFWLGVAALTLIVESATADLVSIWFTPGAVVAMILAIWVDLFWVQLLIFLAFSITLLVLMRTHFKKHPILVKNEPMNAEAVLDARGIVVEGIDNLRGTGAVKVKGLVWSARSSDGEEIPADSIVVIEQIDGVKLICRVAEKQI